MLHKSGCEWYMNKALCKTLQNIDKNKTGKFGASDTEVDMSGLNSENMFSGNFIVSKIYTDTKRHRKKHWNMYLGGFISTSPKSEHITVPDKTILLSSVCHLEIIPFGIESSGLLSFCKLSCKHQHVKYNECTATDRWYTEKTCICNLWRYKLSAPWYNQSVKPEAQNRNTL